MPRLRFCHVESSPFRAVDVKDGGHTSSDFGPKSSGSEERLSNAFKAFLPGILNFGVCNGILSVMGDFATIDEAESRSLLLFWSYVLQTRDFGAGAHCIRVTVLFL